MRLSRSIVALLAFSWASSIALAQARTCDDLWYLRNSEYKAAGYCFHTERAIKAFGNAGCAYDDEAAVPLSRGQRLIVSEIIQREREMGCR